MYNMRSLMYIVGNTPSITNNHVLPNTELLLEKAVTNQMAAEDVTDLIINLMPSEFPLGKTDGQELDEYNYRFRNQSLRLLSKYKNTIYEKAIDSLKYHTIIWNNSGNISNTAGMYISQPHMHFQFFISSFMREARTFTKEEILSKVHKDLPIKTFRALVLHEVRHMFQSFSYSKFYHSKKRQEKYSYKTSPVEIDAAWVHNLEDHSYKNYETATEFVNAIMNSFSNYKELSPSQVKHYKAKTAAYWLAKHRGFSDTDAITLADRLAAKRVKVASFISNHIINDKELDLRNIAGYDPDSSRFLFPGVIFNNVKNILLKKTNIKPELAPIVFITLALSDLGSDALKIKQLLKIYYGITIDDALRYSDSAFQGGFDADALRNFILKVFN